jgi:hypothetical protein
MERRLIIDAEEQTNRRAGIEESNTDCCLCLGREASREASATPANRHKESTHGTIYLRHVNERHPPPSGHASSRWRLRAVEAPPRTGPAEDRGASASRTETIGQFPELCKDLDFQVDLFRSFLELCRDLPVLLFGSLF